MTQETGYNGYANYQTWNVALWIDNDEGAYNYWQERAEHWASEESTSDYWTQEESAKYNLADELEESIKNDNPLSGDASMYADILGHALAGVNWHEIAEGLLESVREDA